MEPITLLVVATFTAGTAVTARSPWSAPRIQEKHEKIVVVQSIPAPTNLLVAPSLPATKITTRKDLLLSELSQFAGVPSDVNDATSSALEDVAAAQRIINALPAGLPLPILMRNDDSTIGMYWDSDIGYADINIEAEMKFSFFSRSRISGVEKFIDELNVAEFTSAWAFENLRVLADTNQLAA